jgi:hypothetical protein
MRFWGPNIKISGEWIMTSPNDDNLSANQKRAADDFEKQAQDILRDISRNDVGKPVLDAFTKASHAVTIRPLAANAVTKMGAQATFGDSANETDTGAPSAPGAGSDSTIWFYTSSVNIAGHLYRSDDSLIHESFHSLRQARGRWRATHQPGWGNREELYATMITNIYASKDGRNSDMRGSHGFAFVAMTLTDEQFSQQYHNEILDFRTNTLDIYQIISDIQGCWNPLRVFETRFWLMHSG